MTSITPRSLAALGLAAAAALAAGPAAAADTYPSRTVKIVVPYPPGGTNDLVVRLLAQRLTERLGHPFIVENKPGASGNLGAELVSRAPADGYTLLLVTMGHS